MVCWLLLAFCCWHWEPSVGAEYYRVRWSHSPVSFCLEDYHDVSGTECIRDIASSPRIPIPGPGELIYIVVEACNEYGCSGTEHGPVEECEP